MVGSSLKNLELVASMCGQSGKCRIILGTTMRSEVPSEVAKRLDMELRNISWDDMLGQGCKFQPFSDSYESAWEMIGTLPTIDDSAIPSREINADKVRLNETAPGIKLAEELQKLITDQKDAAARLEHQARTEANPVFVAERDRRENKMNGVSAFFAGRRARKSGIRYVQLSRIPFAYLKLYSQFA